MLGYGKLPVDEVVRRILEPAEERLIVEKTLAIDYTVGAYVGILGETGLRMDEGMNLKRELFNVKRKKLTLEASKNYKTREVPLSDIRTVKEWLGHRDIKTTMLYLRFVEGHAEAKFREPEKAELVEFAGGGDKVATN
jgi:integrase